MLLKNWCSIHARWSKISLKHSIRFCGIFSKFKTELYCISSKVPDCIFENHQLWQSGFSRVYLNCCCSCSFEPGIIKICLSSHKMYSNNIVNFQECTVILKACPKKVWNLIECTMYTYLSPHTFLASSLSLSLSLSALSIFICHVSLWTRFISVHYLCLFLYIIYLSNKLASCLFILSFYVHHLSLYVNLYLFVTIYSYL